MAVVPAAKSDAGPAAGTPAAAHAAPGAGPDAANGPRPLGRRFAAHLSAVGLANLADGVVATGVPLVAITMTRSPELIGLLTAAVWLPWLLLGIPAGVLVDRWDRRRTMTVALSARGLLLLGAAALAVAGELSIWWLIAMALAYGVTEVFTDLAASAQVPALVGRDATDLRRATSRLLGVEHVANGFVGPPLAGLLVAVGAAWVVGVPAVVVLLAALVLTVALRGRYVAPHRAVPPVGSTLGRLGEGMTTLWRHPVLRPLILGGGLWNFASTAFAAVIVLWMVGPGSAGGLTPQVWALVAVAMPVGAVVGSALASRVLNRWSEMRVLVVCWGVVGVLNLLPLLWPNALGLATFLLLVAPLGVIGNVVSGSLRPRLVPEHLLGKVGGAARVIGYGAMPLGAVVGGQVAALLGIPVVLAGVAAVMVLATVYVALSVPQSLVDEHQLAP
ncbi:MFS transporter [Ornithinimicrobium cerasi]|uniref:MFS transporter n=1 Tax=Ornithinimicrobium cerasi TaxID=2248773 RepID=UPI000EFEEE9D|nr:MFS transporter [Ornithinimicrobium cerasi]